MLGEIGILPDVFWSLSWEELDVMIEGYERRMARQLILQREIMAMLVNVHRKDGSTTVKGEDIMPLITDKVRESRLMTREEWDAMNDLMDKVIWQKREN